jgi:hypothetical protein
MALPGSTSSAPHNSIRSDIDKSSSLTSLDAMLSD